MIRLPESLAAWGKPAFDDTFKREVQKLDADMLPLQQGLSLSSHIADSPFSVRILDTFMDADSIRIKTGILYAGIIAGCSCADDPTPVTEQTEYCEVMFEINKLTAQTRVSLIDG